MKIEVLNKLTRAVHKVGFVLKKHSPEILMVTGIAGGVVSAVMACKATTKLSAILDETAGSVDKIHKAAEDKTLTAYSEEDAKKDLGITYVQAGVKIFKLYAHAVTLGMLSISAILASNDILRKRNAALGAAFAVVDSSYKAYRGKVIERFGKQTDDELRHGLKVEEVERTVKKEGGDEKVKQTVDTIENRVSYPSEYACFFDRENPEWTTDHDYNLTFLRAQQQHANDLLRVHGYLFLNDVYEMLGFPKTKAGQVVGWVQKPGNNVGDNYIDFGVREVYESDDLDDWNPTIILDFNVDGNVMDRANW